MNTGFLRHAVATVLTVYGIETAFSSLVVGIAILFKVATALTVYGIETSKLQAYYNYQWLGCNSN